MHWLFSHILLANLLPFLSELCFTGIVIIWLEQKHAGSPRPQYKTEYINLKADANFLLRMGVYFHRKSHAICGLGTKKTF